MRRALGTLVLALALAACGRTQAPAPTPHASDAAPPSAPSASGSARPATPKVVEDHAVDASFEWGFWPSADELVLATPRELWTLAMPCAEPVRTPATIGALLAANGADRFVVEDASGAFTMWDASATKPIGPIDHPAPKRPGAMAPDGSFVALGGCKEIAADPKLPTSCGEIYDRAGKHVAGFTTKHPFEDLVIRGTWILARGSTSGLTVIDAATGRTIATRPAWRRMVEVHAYNRPDLHEVVGSQLLVGSGDTIEAIDLTTGKTAAKTTVPDRTVAALGPKTLRVAILQGAASRVRVWDVATNKVTRTFELAREIQVGANCTHCAIEVDEADEDVVWLTSAYTNDRLRMHVTSGAIEHVEAHDLRSEGTPSPTHRLRDGWSRPSKAARGTKTCALEERATGSAQSIDAAYCNDASGPKHRGQDEWPYPGFAPGGRHLASISGGELHVLDVGKAARSCNLHRPR